MTFDGFRENRVGRALRVRIREQHIIIMCVVKKDWARKNTSLTARRLQQQMQITPRILRVARTRYHIIIITKAYSVGYMYIFIYVYDIM